MFNYHYYYSVLLSIFLLLLALLFGYALSVLPSVFASEISKLQNDLLENSNFAGKHICCSDVIKLLTHLSVVQTGERMLSLTTRWPRRRRSPSWCCPCTLPPRTCTGRPHWTGLQSREKLVTTKVTEELQVVENKRSSWKTLLLTLWYTYRWRGTPRVCIQRRILFQGPFHHPPCKPQAGWQQCQTGTSGYFSPKEMCLSSSVPSQSTHLETHGNIFQCKSEDDYLSPWMSTWWYFMHAHKRILWLNNDTVIDQSF